MIVITWKIAWILSLLIAKFMTKLNLIRKAAKSVRAAAEMCPDYFFSSIENYEDKLLGFQEL